MFRHKVRRLIWRLNSIQETPIYLKMIKYYIDVLKCLSIAIYYYAQSVKQSE